MASSEGSARVLASAALNGRRVPAAAVFAVLLAATLATTNAVAPPAQPTGERPAPPRTATSLLDSLLAVLATGDQAAFEHFVEQAFATAALAEYPAEDHASSLARIYTDSGGFELERVAGMAPGWIQAEARDRIVGAPHCLTLTLSEEGGRIGITDFTARGLAPASPELATPSPGELTAAIESMVDAYLARDLFSGVILIAKDDEIVFERAYGRASLAYDAPITLETRLNVASIGKMLTGVAIAQLVDAGKLSYDDTVGSVLPEFPNAEVRGATIRQLLTHTSGLGPKDYYHDPEWASRWRLRSVGDYLEIVVRTPHEGEPGKYLYSNSGYVILGALIEKVTGGSFYDYIRQRVFLPAGMTRSLYPELDMEEADLATPLTNFFTKGDDYVYRLGRPRSAVLELAAKGGPQGGAAATARDLLAFVRALRGGALVSSARLAEMTRAQSQSGAGAPGLAGDVREGLGIEVIRSNGHAFYGHSGGDLGIASMVYWYPDTGYTTILLSNRDPRAARIIANATRTLITRRTLGDAEPPAQGCVPPESGSPGT